MTPACPAAAGPGPGLRAWLAATRIDGEVRELRPDYSALLIVAGRLRPGPSDQASEAILAAAEQRARARLGGSRPEDLPPVAQWREAFRAFGAKPQRTRPSVEALLRRLDPGLPRIDRITDAYNAVSPPTCFRSAARISPAMPARPGSSARPATRTSTRSPTGGRRSSTPSRAR